MEKENVKGRQNLAAMVPAPLNSCPVCALCKGGWSAFYICPENISFSNSHKSGYVGYCQALQSRSHTLHFPVFQYCLENPSSFFMSLFKCLLLPELTVMNREFPMCAKLLQSCLTLRPHRWKPTRLPYPWDSLD